MRRRSHNYTKKFLIECLAVIYIFIVFVFILVFANI